MADIDQTFRRPTMVEAEFSHPVMTTKLLMERQTSNFNLIFDGSGVCQGADVWFLQSGADLVTHSGTAASGTTCAIPAGTQLQTNSESYDNNCFVEAVAEVEDNRCDNELQFVQESAKAIAKAMNDIRRKLNTEHALPLLTNNVQVNQWANATQYNFLDQGTGNRLKLAPGDWSFESLQYIKALAAQNDLDEYFILDGMNLWADRGLAEVRRLNDDQRDEVELFNQFDIHWDLRDLDATLGRRSTFVVNPNVLAYWNVTWNTPVPQNTDPSNNVWEYTLADPMLMYNRNGVMAPVQYEVEYRFECINRNNTTQKRYVHRYYIRHIGGMAIAPLGFNKAAVPARELSGILEIVNEA